MNCGFWNVAKIVGRSSKSTTQPCVGRDFQILFNLQTCTLVEADQCLFAFSISCFPNFKICFAVFFSVFVLQLAMQHTPSVKAAQCAPGTTAV